MCGRMPEDSPQCVAEENCRAQGHEWVFDGNSTIVAGRQQLGHCDPVTSDAALSD
jgi:hypothetical protein